MKTLNTGILILCISAGFLIISFPASASGGTGLFRKHIYASSDTSGLNRFIHHALALSSRSMEISLMKSQIDSAESFCSKHNIEFPSSLNLARAEYFLLSGDFRNASEEATIAMRKARNDGETEVLARTLGFLGKYSFRTGFLMESISYFENSISIAKKNRMKGIIPGDYVGLKDVYDKLGNLKEYRSTLDKEIIAAGEEKDTVNLEIGYWHLGRSYTRDSTTDKERNFHLADSLLRKCLDISMVRKDTQFTVLSLAVLGWNYYVGKKYDEAIDYFDRTLGYSIPSDMPGYSSNAYGNLGTIYRDLGNTEKSLLYYRKSIEQAQKVNDFYNLSGVYKDMSEMYLRLGDTADAYKSYVLYKKYNDAFLLKYNSQGLTDARLRYDTDTHNKEVELLSLKLYNQKLVIYGSSGLFLLSLAVLVLLLSRARLKAKRRISEMNRKIAEVTQANLRQQMNPHFIFNTLNSIQYYMYQHDKLATNNYLTKFSSLMRKVLENSQHTSIPLRDELDALSLYLELEMIRFKDKFEYAISVDEEIDTLLYRVPTMLIQPYVENSISHGLMPAENKGFVKIDLKLKNGYILCTIEDNGIGREAARENKMRSESNHNSLGTRIISSRLELVNALYGTSLKTIYSDVMNANGKPEGTRVEIQIPILS